MRLVTTTLVFPALLALPTGCATRPTSSSPSEAAPASAARQTSGAPLAWLAGCWEQTTATRVVQEHWLPPAGGTLLGVSRTVRRGAAGDAMVEFEFLRIFARGDALVYAAQPSGRPPTEFVADSAGDSAVTFVNEAHDFPQRITYRAVGSDSLVARVEGPSGGGVQGIDFRYARVACD